MAFHEVVDAFDSWGLTSSACKRLLRKIEEYYIDSDDRERDRLIPKIAELMEALSRTEVNDVDSALAGVGDRHSRRLSRLARAVYADHLPPAARFYPGWRKGEHMPDPDRRRRLSRKRRRSW